MPDAPSTSGTPGHPVLSDTPLVVAIDGPSGSGKSSTARGVAARLGLAYLDTGAMYRAATWLAVHEGVDLDRHRRRRRPGRPARSSSSSSTPRTTA